MIESRLYAVLLGEKSITHYYGADIVMLIELGVFHPDDYIYCFSLSAWIKAVQCEEVSHYLTLNAYRRSSEVIIAAPDFCPPPAPEKPPYSLKEVLKGNILDQDDDSLKRVSFLEEQFKVLSEENLRLSQITQKGSHKESAESIGNNPAFEKIFKDREAQLLAHHKKLKIENKNLVEELKKQAKKFEDISTNQGDWGHERSQLLLKLKELKKSLRLKEAQVLTLEKSHKLNKRKMKSLNSLKEEKDREVFLEEQRLIGESFKVINSPQWMIKREGQEKGPYRFSDVADWYSKNLISKRTLVKRTSDKVYGRLEDIYEFNTRVIERYEEIGGQFESIFYIKRTDYRAPFFEVAIVEFNDVVEKAQCTSLSIGGCFIELKDLEGIKESSVLKVKIQANYLSVPILASVIVKNIKSGRNKGVGCQFLDLEADQLNAIEEFVTSFLESQKVVNPLKRAA